MVDKNIIKSRFAANYNTYDDNAVVQKLVIENLTKLISYKNYENVLEIGCGTGLLSKKLDYLNAKKLFLNDLCEEVKKHVVIKNLPYEFIIEDAEKINFPPNLDLIVSASAFQWFEDLEFFLQKAANALNPQGKLIFSTFVLGNYNEIATTFGASLPYKTEEEILALAEKYFVVKSSSSQSIVLYFEDIKSLFAHIKNTGVNGLSTTTLTKSKLITAKKIYENLRTQKGLPLTYMPAYFSLEKKS